MHEGGVEVLGVVLHEDLPVELPLVMLPHGQLHLGGGVRIDGRGQRTEVERSGVGVRVDEHEARPGAHRDRVEVMLGGVEALHTLHAAGASQRPVEAVQPGVVGARQGLGRAAAAGERAAPMPAHVEEPSQRPIGVAHDDEGEAGSRLHRHVAPRLRHVVRHPHAGPPVAEDRVELALVMAGVVVPGGGERPGGGQRTWHLADGDLRARRRRHGPSLELTRESV